MKLYHYNTKHFDTVCPQSLQPGYVEDPNAKPIKAGIYGRYVDNVSLFLEPAPLDIIAKAFNNEHPFWRSGVRVYEHIIDTDDLPHDIEYMFVETPELMEYFYNTPWSDTDKAVQDRFLQGRKDLRDKVGDYGKGRHNLILRATELQGTTRDAYLRIRERENYEDIKTKYAATVPHLMCYPGMCLPVTRATRRRIA